MSKQSPSSLSWLAAALLLAPTLAMAAPPSVTANFTGSGELCRLSPGTSWTCAAGYTISGSITLQLVGAADPSGDPFEANGDNWMRASMQAQWAGPELGAMTERGSFTFPVNDPLAVNSTSATVRNDYPFFSGVPAADEMLLSGTSVVTRPVDAASSDFLLSGFLLSRSSNDPTWLSSLQFDLLAGLAPTDLAGGENRLEITFLAGQVNAADPLPQLDLAGSYRGQFTPTSWTVSAVPEPGSWALFGAGGLALLPLLRRRRARLG